MNVTDKSCEDVGTEIINFIEKSKYLSSKYDGLSKIEEDDKILDNSYSDTSDDIDSDN